MTLVHAIRRPRFRRAVISGFAVLTTVVVAAAPAAAGTADDTRPWVAVVEDGDTIRVERFDALGRADAAHEAQRETGGAPILALEPDRRAAATAISLDPLRSAQWALDKLGFEPVRDAVEPSTVTVAVVDTGVEASHEDLAGTVLGGWDALTGRPGADTDGYGHGTHVAGIVAALTGNGLGGSGAASGVRILPVRVLDADGQGWSSSIAEGIRWAADHGADVINLSLGGTVPSDVYRVAINYAVNGRGAVVVASAGNDYQSGNPMQYPASDPDVIAVGASTASGARAAFSSTGGYVAISAPGTSILAPCPADAGMCTRLARHAEDGGVFAFSDLPFAGSLAGRSPARPIVAVASAPNPGRAAQA